MVSNRFTEYLLYGSCCSSPTTDAGGVRFLPGKNRGPAASFRVEVMTVFLLPVLLVFVLPLLAWALLAFLAMQPAPRRVVRRDNDA
jgi:hypothetical protein